METIELDQLTSKIHSKKEAQSFCRRIGKFFIKIIGRELPSSKLFSKEHFYAFMQGKKDLLKTEECVVVDIPNYYCVSELQKKNLIEHCKNSIGLRRFLPDVKDLSNIPRDFLLQVRFNFNLKY